ncbi:MAG: MATE family efflux transporter [Christensenellaceae bacterium]|jgi:putative MATE family efflux protein
MDQKPLFKQFLHYCIPTVLSLWVFSLYMMVDGLFVARGVGEMALSAVNLCMPFMQLLFAVAILFAVGTSTVCAILSGQQKQQQANRLFSQNTVLLLVAGIAVMALVLCCMDQIILFLGATPETAAYMREYMTGIVPFCISIMVSYSLEILVKTDGFPRLAMIAVTVGALLNCALDYLFVFVFHLGVFGAAVATGISQTVVMLVYIIHFLKKRGKFRFCRFRFNFRVYRRIIPIGVSDSLTELSVGVAVFLFNRAILQFIGVEGIVTYTIISYIGNIVIMTMAGISQGMQPLVSYAHGCGDEKKHRQLLKYAVRSVLFVSVCAFLICLAFAKPVTAAFIPNGDRVLVEYSIWALRIYSISFLLAGFNIVAGGYLTALERPKSAIVISLSRSIVLLALSLFVLTLLFGGQGIWWTMTVTETLTLVLSIWLLRRETKKEPHKTKRLGYAHLSE